MPEDEKVVMVDNGNRRVIRRDLYELSILAIILLLAGYLRFVNLSHNPGWYSDEGTLVEISQNLLDGKVEYFALNQSTLLAARMPLFLVLLSGLFRIFGASITTLRYFTASLGLSSIGLLYLFLRDAVGKDVKTVALGSACLYAIYPQAVLYHRLGFSYNLIAPLYLLVVWFSWKYLKSERVMWIIIAGAVVGVGTLSDLVMYTALPIVLAVGLVKNWKHGLWGTLTAMVPIGCYGLYGLIMHREAFLFDAHFTIFRLGSIPLIAQYPIIASNYAALISKDYWWSLAVVGIFIYPAPRFRKLLILSLFTPLLLIGRTVDLSGLSLYLLIPLFPLISTGVAILLIRGVPNALKTIKRGFISIYTAVGWSENSKNLTNFRNFTLFLATSLMLFLVIISPFAITAYKDIQQVKTGSLTGLEPVLVEASDAKNAIDYVNARTHEDDLVIASPAIAWAIDANAVDFQLTLAAMGKNTKHFPENVPTSRFNFEAAYPRAKFALIDPVWRNWAIPNMSAVERMTEEIHDWQLVRRTGEIEIYLNPNNIQEK